MEYDLNFLKSLAAQGGGSVGKRLLASGMDVNSLRNNGTLRKEEWNEYDTAIIEAHQDRLVCVSDLLGRSLRYTLTNGLGKTTLESENVNDMRDAQISMDGVTVGQNDAVNYELVGLPLPLYHKDYQISIRKLAASRNTGDSLDTTQARLASRKVADLTENTLVNGAGTFAFAGYNLYGYTNFPSRNTGTIADWSLTATTGATIVANVLAMKQALLDDGFFGPFEIYIPSTYETKMDEDYSSTKGSNTIRERILAISGIAGIKVADKLSDGNVLMINMSVDVARMVEGLPLTNVEWEEKGGMITLFKVMTINVPQLRTDQAGNSGIAHYTTA